MQLPGAINLGCCTVLERGRLLRGCSQFNTKLNVEESRRRRILKEANSNAAR